ncbi:hypothetical protein GP475_06545 [Corynebacterium poyangense]|uniref:LemA family protein n=1 Tax=Corynebacterium poyangense TaxID=2684405 RepID=A0A7H0SP60_9CORY|nr:hypothetical protein [Corynebacterium poyangense]QNQ90335.1 hypothetical protein GP475_06545 [Corynebacterium poyangense]
MSVGAVLWVVLAVLITVILAWAYMTAQRLNRLHIRTDAARAQLQAALDRRAAVTAAIYPAARRTAAQAEAIPLAPERFMDRASQEAEISRIIAAAADEQPGQIVDAHARLQLAHRFYNDAVRSTRELRTRPLVRFLRLGGTAPLPEYFEFVDDTLLD